ncbi:myosin-12-like isoform X1 [Canna indica]|uniref:Myosin-12-like isoform X1 n=1 Tax=Canna indica TaxID=4628 RepID=A0AAQ3KFF1_9LILI|nr:myosin-12-like isoform X1 [Canna indica]
MGALKEAKDKLEKKVEELTWRLELVEKRMRKLKGTKLQSYKVKLDEAHEAMTKEIEGARIAIEQAPPITKEVLVEENSMLELLTTRNKELESENKVLRQQTLLGSTNEDLSERKITTLESDNDLLRNQQKTDCQSIDSSEVIKPPSENELVHDQQAIVHQPSVTSELTEPITAKVY